MEINRQHLFFPDIAFASGSNREAAKEEHVTEHMLCHVKCGEVYLREAASERIFRAGDTFLLRRNHLVKCLGQPMPNRTPYGVIFFVLKKEFLQEYELKNRRAGNIGTSAPLPPVVALASGPLLQGLFNSLLPYLEAGARLSPAIAQHKLEEAILILQEQDERLEQWLFDPAEPGKIDLEAFMRQNYMFNIPITKFATLTGRSLSTFQRDFQKIFGINAARWLLQRRLEAAYALLAQGDKRPVDVYMEVGFEDPSHFSRAFKKEFGYSPSELRGQESSGTGI